MAFSGFYDGGELMGKNFDDPTRGETEINQGLVEPSEPKITVVIKITKLNIFFFIVKILIIKNMVYKL